MSYDYPYRLEIDSKGNKSVTTYSVIRTGEGVICSGPNWDEMRKLVDAANAAADKPLHMSSRENFKSGPAKF